MFGVNKAMRSCNKLPIEKGEACKENVYNNWNVQCHILMHDKLSVSNIRYALQYSLENYGNIALKSHVWGCPIGIFSGGSPGKFRGQSAQLLLDVVDQFYRSTSVCTGFNLCLPYSQTLPVSEMGSQYQHHCFIDFQELIFRNFQNIFWRAQPKSTKHVQF